MGAYHPIRSKEIKIGEFNVLFEWKRVTRLRMVYKRQEKRFQLLIPYYIEESEAVERAEGMLPWMKKVFVREGARPTVPLPTIAQVDKFVDELPERLQRWQREMEEPGVRFSIKDMSSRWGSCNPQTRSISISLRLANRPEQCIDYVIVHELAHLKHPNHSDEFWSHVARYCPDYKECRELLRR